MLDSIKHIIDDNVFFQEDSVQVHCVCNTIQLSEICDFRVFAFCQVVQKHKLFEVCDETQSSPLLTYFISGIRPFYNLAVKQTIARTNIVRA